jgi:DDE domain
MFESFDIFNPRPVRRSSDNPVIRKIQHAHAGQSFVPSVLPGAATRRTFPFEANGTTSIKRSTGRERRSTFSCAVTAASRRHKRSFRKALATNLNRWPRKVTLDGHVPSHRALRLLRREDPKWRNIEVRTCKYLNNIVERDHRAIKRRCASMAGFKSFDNAAITIAGIELAHRIRKRQFSFGAGRPRRERSLEVLWDRALA